MKLNKWSVMKKEVRILGRKGADISKILKLVLIHFVEYGLENTGMLKLSEASGITNGGLIYHFGSKDNLIIQATAIVWPR